MARIKPSPEMIEGIVARVPEGFIHRSVLGQRLKLHNRAAENINKAMQGGKVGREGEYFFDPTRITPQQVREYSLWSRPAFPSVSNDWQFLTPTILEQQAMRDQQLQEFENPAYRRMVDALQKPPFYTTPEQLFQQPGDEDVLADLLGMAILRRYKDLIFDSLHIGWNTMLDVVRRRELVPIHHELVELLKSKPGNTLPIAEIAQKFGSENISDLLAMDGFATFTVPMKTPPYMSNWVRLKTSNQEESRQVALENVKIPDEEWEESLKAAGDLMRVNAKEGKSNRVRTLANSYTVIAAAKRLGVKPETMEIAVDSHIIPSFTDPEGTVRISAQEVENAYNSPEYRERITENEPIRPKEIAIVTGLGYTAIRYRLKKANLNRGDPTWAEVRGRWGLPDTLREFRTTLKEKVEQRRAEVQARLDAEREQERQERDAERQRRQALRARLVAAFPTWRHAGRADQQIILHAGPPNSGKTHHAINALAEAGNGWYLAPLRLLAFEIFDRLNQRGVLCNLLTGEEHIAIPGAQITAATVEMFNSERSGDCVVIDEAQMLADSDRGWAWTRALMEAQSPEIHVIGPLTSRDLIQRLADAAAIPLKVIEHERLTPIKVAENHWPVNKLPPRTILVAFSRQMVLQLKSDLEQLKRSVSVVYGSLPPEVRRKQSERFANGETEICVATDAVGMGLNLPADYVCFFEVEKFDGKEVRELTPTEVQQIGGRAGRFGLSQGGEVGATSKRDLNRIRRLFHEDPLVLTHARVAPTVEDIELIPGNLATRLTQWGSLESIPEDLKGAIKTADMSERIELAKMLTDREVALLGMESALKLVNAPTRQNTRSYWRLCAQAIINGQPMPVPPSAPRKVSTNFELDEIETCVASADIYLWLGSRREFTTFAPEEFHVRMLRAHWGTQIDEALAKRLDLARRCASCGTQLPTRHRYRICDNCYAERFGYY